MGKGKLYFKAESQFYLLLALDDTENGRHRGTTAEVYGVMHTEPLMNCTHPMQKTYHIVLLVLWGRFFTKRVIKTRMHIYHPKTD